MINRIRLKTFGAGRRGGISRGRILSDVFFCSQVDGPITEGREGAYKWGIIALAGGSKMWAEIISA